MKFVVERNLPGLTEAQLASLRDALGEASRRLSTPLDPVRYVESRYDPASSRCVCLFDAGNRAAVARVNAVAQAPYSSIRVVEAFGSTTAGADGALRDKE